MADDQLDLVSRDPNGVNAHLGTLLFDDVLGEPDGIHSIGCVWRVSYTCFECWKGLCYKLLTLFCGICIAMEWGCEFAYIAFAHIWFITPCMKIFEINCGLCQKIYASVVNCCMLPCFEALGGCFIHFKRPSA